MTPLGKRLAAAGLNEEAIAAAVGPVGHAESASVHARATRAGLVSLFVLGEPVAAAELPVDSDELERAGLADRDGDLVRPRFRLAPWEGLLLAHDDESEVHRSDFVTGVSSATRTLASFTIREPVERALDVGTGCGSLALLLAANARAVVATDVNPRALQIARINADLNGRTLDLREGSWFEPVADERFDLIVANPPFVISPDTSHVFRDAGLEGDAVSRDVVRGAAAHLREGGYATVLCNWICRSPGETWQPLQAWTDGSGCDALLLAHEPVDPFSYAARWNEPLRGDPAAYAAAVDRWLAYYARAGVAAIGIGVVVLRRREGADRGAGLDLQGPSSGNGGRHLLRLFAALDAPLDGDVLDGRYRLVDGHRLDQALRFEAGGYQLGTVRMSLDDSVGLVADVDAHALPALFALDPARPLREVAGDNPDAVARTVSQLHALGFLERA